MDSRSNLNYAPAKVSRIRIPESTVVNKYTKIKAKVDTSDPAPWIHAKQTRELEELVKLDGFVLNPRFKGIVESRSFDSVKDILKILEHEDKGPVIKVKRPHAFSTDPKHCNETTKETEEEQQKMNNEELDETENKRTMKNDIEEQEDEDEDGH